MIVLSGRYAGRKAVVIKASDEGNDSRKFGHAIGEYFFSRDAILGCMVLLTTYILVL